MAARLALTAYSFPIGGERGDRAGTITIGGEHPATMADRFPPPSVRHGNVRGRTLASGRADQGCANASVTGGSMVSTLTPANFLSQYVRAGKIAPPPDFQSSRPRSPPRLISMRTSDYQLAELGLAGPKSASAHDLRVGLG